MADVTGQRQTGAVLLIVVLALGAALLYGVADFMSGVAARRIPVLGATTINYAVASVVLTIVVVAVGGAWSTPAIVSGVVAGLLAAVGFLTFTAALAAGPISLMTPLIALLSSAVPVVVALVLGERLEPIAWIAIVVAIVGSVLIGVERRVSARELKPAHARVRRDLGGGLRLRDGGARRRPCRRRNGAGVPRHDGRASCCCWPSWAWRAPCP